MAEPYLVERGRQAAETQVAAVESRDTLVEMRNLLEGKPMEEKSVRTWVPVDIDKSERLPLGC